jgi:hypothetical protein
MEKLVKLLGIALCVTLTACASSVKRPDSAAGYRYDGSKFCSVELTVSNDATKDPNDRVRFDDKALRDMIQRKMEVSGIVDENSSKKVSVEITDIRVRSSFNAFMWGFMAGDDHILGNVTLTGDDGKPLHTFNVSASYALGGFAGMNETRMSWLFEKFSANRPLTRSDCAAGKIAASVFPQCCTANFSFLFLTNSDSLIL